MFCIKNATLINKNMIITSDRQGLETRKSPHMEKRKDFKQKQTKKIGVICVLFQDTTVRWLKTIRNGAILTKEMASLPMIHKRDENIEIRIIKRGRSQNGYGNIRYT